jgi:hypothetical protein
MSAIGREGGHSRGRTRQPLPGDTANVGTSSTSAGSGIDTERQNYIGHASDRGSFGESERRMPRQENNNEIRSDNNAGRGTL